ncbi:hypothetical protein CLAFUW4_10538 [Fulvia fulva]|uniref:Uncharacterized protein n=1 Tax=Passalora fulva TaxID=5499 RepID=A0A9Q8LG80_PASFU|nr:uncharacterized protein CLAFUR5_05152 [Fulvia fulva]KAK4616311.1 hypothetical protein CLAFUR4_10543 [Fulvia fulva]KAK4616625.1 hypothetical protein CLAFUR0_10546 [Fulvia fulva]UJO16864.1 hypothetical protein CLAFUR5_05152 [Fulvia fulva]WPV19690.1 hypothetical protein CLAFUW4_10538 [Fulvia fulva]WPV34041.1 hypothetical protein CLAFUW7_10540 [Fulvia fulva]
MRLTTLSIALAGAASVHAVGDSAKKIIADLQSIQNLTEAVTGAVNAFNGSLALALPITVATNDVLAKISSSTEDAKTAQPFSNADATALGPYTQDLAYAVNSSIAALIGKKREFESGNLSPIVIQSLEGQKNSSKIFSDTVSMLVPENTRSVAQALSSQTLESIQQGIDCFSGMNQTCNPTNYFEAKAMAEAAEKAATGGVGRSAASLGAVVVAGLVAFVTL